MKGMRRKLTFVKDSKVSPCEYPNTCKDIDMCRNNGKICCVAFRDWVSGGYNASGSFYVEDRGNPNYKEYRIAIDKDWKRVKWKS